MAFGLTLKMAAGKVNDRSSRQSRPARAHKTRAEAHRVSGASVSGLMGLPEDAKKLGLRPSWLGYVGVDDVDATADRIKELGGTLHVPPKDVPNISRFSIAVDPQMATIALFKWLKGGQEQPAELDGRGRVGWHELLGADWEKAFAFYRELFGWQKAEMDTGAVGTYQLFSAGGETIGGMFTKPPTVPVPFWLYYFNVADIDVAIRRVKAGRGAILNGPIEVPGNRWIVQCTDPQGAIFALAGKRSHNGIGYFERVASREPSVVRSGLAQVTRECPAPLGSSDIGPILDLAAAENETLGLIFDQFEP
jgi:predicted enzyme related to lactoylglutathione lyase